MIRVLLFFVLLFVVFFVGIKAMRALSGKEAWQLTKLLAYSLVCAILSITFLIGIVVLF